ARVSYRRALRSWAIPANRSISGGRRTGLLGRLSLGTRVRHFVVEELADGFASDVRGLDSPLHAVDDDDGDGDAGGVGGRESDEPRVVLVGRLVRKRPRFPGDLHA